MSRRTDEVKNWMNMFPWIVKLIRDEYGVDEAVLLVPPRWKPTAAW